MNLFIEWYCTTLDHADSSQPILVGSQSNDTNLASQGLFQAPQQESVTSNCSWCVLQLGTSSYRSSLLGTSVPKHLAKPSTNSYGNDSNGHEQLPSRDTMVIHRHSPLIEDVDKLLSPPDSSFAQNDLSSSSSNDDSQNENSTLTQSTTSSTQEILETVATANGK